MKKLILLLLIISFVPINGQRLIPKISSSEQQFDFKDVKRDELFKHDFYVKNIGSGILKIRDVKSSCECTVIQPVKKTLQPGDSVKVTAEFNTAGKIGYQRHHIYILSNDPEDPEYRLTLLANVVLNKDEEEKLPTIKIPYTVYDFGDVKQGELLSHNIEIKNVGKNLLRIKKIKTGCNFIKLSMKKKNLKHNETGKLTLRFNSKNLMGQQSCVVTIRSNDPRVRVAIITVRANIIK